MAISTTATQGQEIAIEAIHTFLADEPLGLEDAEDGLAVARHRLRERLGEVTYATHAQAKERLGLSRQ